MRKTKRLLSVVIAFCVSISMLMIPGTFVASAENLDDLYDKYEANEQRIKDAQASIEAAKSKKSSQQEIIDEINKQIDGVKAQIDILNQRIDTLDTSIGKLNSDISELQSKITKLNAVIRKTVVQIVQVRNDIDKTFNLLKRRLRATYITGEASSLEILLSANDVSSFLIKSEFVKRTAEQDKELISELNKKVEKLDVLKSRWQEKKKEVQDEKGVLDEQREELIQKQNDVRSSKNILDLKQQAYAAKQQTARAIMNKLDKNSEAYRQQIARNEQEQQEIEAKIQELLARESAVSYDDEDYSIPETPNIDVKPVNPGANGWLWPLTRKDVEITSEFGYRIHPIYGTYTGHSGVDISGGGIYGTPILAAKSGRVIHADLYYGYGNCVIIDHGNGYSTLYGHCSALACSYQQYVKQGQVIAYVGNTGNSTGAHLHFEVRVNGECVNPLDYVSF